MSRRPNSSQITQEIASLPSIPKVPPALSRLRSAPQFDESWFSTYDANPEAAKMFREQILEKAKGKGFTMQAVVSYIQSRRLVMEEQRKKDRVAVAKVKRQEERRRVDVEREQKAQKVQDKEVFKLCQQLKQKLANYPSRTTALETFAIKKPELFREIHSRFITNIREESESVDSIIKNDCSLKRDPEFLSKTYQYKLFAKMEKIIAQFRKDMCAKMYEHVINKYSAATNPIIKNARENYPTIYKKYLPRLEHNIQRIKTGYDGLCPDDLTNNYFDEKFVSGLMDPIVEQMQREIAAVKARPTRLGGKKKTRRNRGKTRGGKTRGGKTRGGKTRGGKTRGGKTRGGKTRGGKTRGGKTRGGQTRKGKRRKGKRRN
jgi:hypothetical protein